jgi:ABC-type lipopolysaccharide export system ATPase subunit
LCDRALILKNGKIIAEGTQEELTQNSTVKESYFGEMFS